MKKSLLQILLILTIVLFLGSIYFYIKIWNGINDNIALGNAAKVEVASSQGDQEHAKDLRLSMAKTGDLRNKIDDFFIPVQEEVNFIELLENSAKDMGIKVVIGSVSSKDGTQTSKGLGILSLSLTIDGTWQKVMQYVALLESLPYKVNINNAEFSRTSDLIINNSVKTESMPAWRAGIQMDISTLNSDYLNLTK
ncbi:MAG: hypothetical protein WCP15_03990 [bacterium]